MRPPPSLGCPGRPSSRSPILLSIPQFGLTHRRQPWPAPVAWGSTSPCTDPDLGPGTPCRQLQTASQGAGRGRSRGTGSQRVGRRAPNGGAERRDVLCGSAGTASCHSRCHSYPTRRCRQQLTRLSTEIRCQRSGHCTWRGRSVSRRIISPAWAAAGPPLGPACLFWGSATELRPRPERVGTDPPPARTQARPSAAEPQEPTADAPKLSLNKLVGPAHPHLPGGAESHPAWREPTASRPSCAHARGRGQRAGRQLAPPAVATPAIWSSDIVCGTPGSPLAASSWQTHFRAPRSLCSTQGSSLWSGPHCPPIGQ